MNFLGTLNSLILNLAYKCIDIHHAALFNIVDSYTTNCKW